MVPRESMKLPDAIAPAEAFNAAGGDLCDETLVAGNYGWFNSGWEACNAAWQAAWTARAGRGDSCPTCELRLRMLRAYEAERSSGVPVAWSRSRTIDNAEGSPIGTDEPELAWGKEPPDDTGWSPLYAHRSPSDRDGERYRFIRDQMPNASVIAWTQGSHPHIEQGENLDAAIDRELSKLNTTGEVKG